MLEKLRTLNTDRMDLDEAVALVTLGQATVNGYQHFDVPAPQWLVDNTAALATEIRRRRTDMLSARAKEIDAQLTSLQTREEKKDALLAERAKLRDALGQA